MILEFAREGHLPFGRFFSKVHPVLQTPLPAILLLYVLCLMFLLGPPAGTVFEFITAFCNYGEYFFGKGKKKKREMDGELIGSNSNIMRRGYFHSS